MISGRLLLVVLAACASFSCAHRRSDLTGPDDGQPFVGVYKAHLLDAEGASHRFRLLLYAEMPDRIHGEILTPLGATRVILDGGNGRLAVTLVPKGVSYVGPADAESLEMILGIPIGLEQLVGALIDGAPPGDSLSLDRVGGNGLPERLEIRSVSAELRLELKRLRHLGANALDVGTGQPPEGTELRPLERLGEDEARKALAGAEGRP